MIYRMVKVSMLVLIGSFLAMQLLGCSSQRLAPEQKAEQLPLGLYKIIGRECAYQPGAPEDCSQSQYLELVKGVFYGIGNDEVALATWLAESPTQEHGYIVRDLRGGKFVSANEFVIKDDVIVKSWFVVDSGTITDYFFVRKARQTPHGEMAGKTHFTLSRTPRTAEIDRLLSYPPPSEE